MPATLDTAQLLGQMDTAQLLAVAAALGWASGLRLYLVVFLTGAAGWFGWVELPQGLHVLQHPAMLGASGFMLFVEFFADKIPGVDTLWDMVHTLVRIPAGALLKKYGVDFIYVGPTERALYPPEGLAKLTQLADVAFPSGEVTIYRVK